MRRVLIAILVAAIAVLSTIVLAPGVLPTARTSVSHPSAGLRAMATDTITPTDSFGFAQYYWYSGTPSGRVYFSAFDPTDTSVSVTIRDLNHTRDAIPDPAKVWPSVPIQGGFNNSYLWGNFYQIPLSLVNAGNWTISVTGTTAGTATAKFFVTTYWTSVWTNQSYYLPGHPGQILFSVNATTNNSLFTSISTVTIVASFSTTGAAYNLLSGTPKTFTSTAFGELNFSLPTTALPDSLMNIVIFANQTTSNGSSSYFSSNLASVAAINTPSIFLFYSCISCSANQIPAGDLVTVQVSELLSTPFGGRPGSGLTVTFSFLNAGVVQNNVPGNPPLTVTTNSAGSASIAFIAASSAFSSTAMNTVTATISDPWNPGLAAPPPLNANANFILVNQSLAPAYATVVWSQASYYGGDTAQVNWAIGGSNVSANGWTADNWNVWEQNGGTQSLLAWGSASGLSGSFQVAVPVTYTGTLSATVTAHNATEQIGGNAKASVLPPQIVLTPSELAFSPGDTITMSVATFGSIFGSATLFEQTTDNNGVTLAQGTVSGGSFSFKIASPVAPTFVSVQVEAQTAKYGIFATAGYSLFPIGGYHLFAGIQTPSSYSDGSYQPGQSVTVSFNVVALGLTANAKVVELLYGPYTSFFAVLPGPGVVIQQFNSNSGTFSYTIPSQLPTGLQLYLAEAIVLGCSGFCFSETFVTFVVNAAPSVLSYELVAGSGFTVGWLILLILIILVVIGAGWMIRRRGRPMMMKPADAGSSGSSGGPPATWQEGGTPPPGVSGGGSSGESGGSQPPLPPPSS